jgi:hypothetical protein
MAAALITRTVQTAHGDATDVLDHCETLEEAQELAITAGRLHHPNGDFRWKQSSPRTWLLMDGQAWTSIRVTLISESGGVTMGRWRPSKGFVLLRQAERGVCPRCEDIRPETISLAIGNPSLPCICKNNCGHDACGGPFMEPDRDMRDGWQQADDCESDSPVERPCPECDFGGPHALVGGEYREEILECGNPECAIEFSAQIPWSD